MSDKELDSLLNFDGLNAAEKMSGKSYKEDEGTAMLGLFLGMTKNRQLADRLAKSRDTFVGITARDFLVRLKEEGFEIARSYPVAERDTLYIHVKRDEGLVIIWETYRGEDSINSGNVLFNLQFRNPDEAHYITNVSGGLARLGPNDKRKIFVGDYDIREALFYKLNEMRSVGDFLPLWVEKPWKKILSYADWKMEKKEDRDALHEQRMSELPKWLKDLMWNNTDA